MDIERIFRLKLHGTMQTFKIPSWSLFAVLHICLRSCVIYVGCPEKVFLFKYLGVKTSLNPAKSAAAVMKRAVSLANSSRGNCIGLAYDGPDVTDLAVSLVKHCYAQPSIW